MRDFRTSRAKGLRNFITQALSMLVFGLAFLGGHAVFCFLSGVAMTAGVVGWCLFWGAMAHRLLEEVL